MTVEDTKQKNVKCSKCCETKSVDRIVKNRKVSHRKKNKNA